MVPIVDLVPIETNLNVQEKPQPVYTLFDMPNFDGQKVYKDVREKMANVVEKFSSKATLNLGEICRVFKIKTNAIDPA